MKGGRLKKISVFSLLFFASIAIVAAIGELYARAIYKQSYLTGFMVSDRVFHHIPPPHYSGHMHSDGDFDVDFKTNNKGMRGPADYRYEKDPGTFRIAVMGDSFVFGVGVESVETASYVLNGLLGASGSTKYDVMNFGVNSYSPLLEYIYLKQELIKYRPDMVILMLDTCDIQDDYLYEPHIIRNGQGDITGCDPFRKYGRPDLQAFCMRWSRLFFILDQKLFQSFRKMKTIGIRNYLTNKARGKRNKTDILTNKEADNIYFDRFLMFRDGKDKKIVKKHWERTAGYVSMIKKYLDEKGIKFVLVTYPYGHQVGPRQWSEGRRYWAFEDGVKYDPAEGFSMMSSFAKDNGIDFVNLYDAMLKASDKQLYYNRDGHWTKYAQALAARAIFDSEVFQKDLK